MYKCVDATSRFKAVMWTAERLGLPKGFDGPVGYYLYVNDVMDSAGYEEEYILDSEGNQVAYFAWCIGQDIHHKGNILDVASVVVNPNADTKGLQKYMMKRFKFLAKLNDCKWLSRCKHEGETLRVYFKEV